MNSSILLLLPVFFPILAALLTLLMKKRFSERPFRNKYVLAVLIINTVLAVLALRTGGSLVLVNLTDTLPIALRVDGMSWLFILLVSSMWLLSGIFSLEYMKHEGNNENYYRFYLLTLGVLVGLGFAANYLSMYLFYECMTLLSLPMVLHTGTKDAIAAGIK